MISFNQSRLIDNYFEGMNLSIIDCDLQRWMLFTCLKEPNKKIEKENINY